MTTSKYYGIDGLSANVQFGRSGPQIRAAATGFSLVLASGTLSPLDVGAATSPTHAVSKSALDAASLTLSDETGALAAKLGLDADGNLVFPSTGPLASATTIASGLIALDAAISAEASRAQAAEGQLATRVSSVEATIGNTQTQQVLNSTLASLGLDASGHLIAFSGSNYLGSVTTARAALVALDAATAAVDAKYGSQTSALSDRIDTASGDLTTLSQNLSTLTGRALLADGTHALSGDLSAAGHRFTSLGDPRDAGDAATKGYADALFAGISGAFLYIGTIAGQPDVNATPTDLGALAKTQPGDYYKVSAAGYFKLGATKVYANVGDGLVFNTAAGFDIIDNTDTKVFGTPSMIAVTGSTDSGYTIDLDASIKSRLSAVEGAASSNTTSITTLSGNLGRAVVAAGLKADGSFQSFSGTHFLDASSTITGSLRALDTALAGVQAGSSALTTNIGKVASAVGLGSGYVYTPASGATVTASASTVADAVAALDAGLTQTGSDLTAANARVDATNARITAAIQGAGLASGGAYTAASNAPILSSATSLAAADTLLEARIIADRAAADGGFVAAASARTTLSNTLNASITAVSSGAGLGSNGAYTAPQSRYIASAVSLADADLRLDTALGALRDDFTNRQRDLIITADGLASATVASSTTPFVLTAPIGGAARQIASFSTSSATTTNLVVDLSVAGYVQLRASTGSATATMRVASQGGAPVEIGDVDADAMIQGRPGRALTLAGGDNTGGPGGNLLLRGGNGTTGLGRIVLCDAVSNPVITVSTGSAVAYIDVSATTSATVLSAQGTAASVDLTFTPKGSGVVSASGARVTSVGTATAVGDAVNLQVMRTAVAQAILPTAQAFRATISETTGSTLMGARPGGRVIAVTVEVLTAFNAGTSVTIGDDANLNYVLDLAALDLTQTVVYALDLPVDIDGANPIRCYVTAASGSTSLSGLLKVTVHTSTT